VSAVEASTTQSRHQRSPTLCLAKARDYANAVDRGRPSWYFAAAADLV